jgi:hypothetical protein
LTYSAFTHNSLSLNINNLVYLLRHGRFKNEAITFALQNKFDLITKEDLLDRDITIKLGLEAAGLATKLDIAKGSEKIIKLMFILSVAQVVITALAVHFFWK